MEPTPNTGQHYTVCWETGPTRANAACTVSLTKWILTFRGGHQASARSGEEGPAGGGRTRNRETTACEGRAGREALTLATRPQAGCVTHPSPKFHQDTQKGKALPSCFDHLTISSHRFASHAAARLIYLKHSPNHSPSTQTPSTLSPSLLAKQCKVPEVEPRRSHPEPLRRLLSPHFFFSFLFFF